MLKEEKEKNISHIEKEEKKYLKRPSLEKNIYGTKK